MPCSNSWSKLPCFNVSSLLQWRSVSETGAFLFSLVVLYEAGPASLLDLVGTRHSHQVWRHSNKYSTQTESKSCIKVHLFKQMKHKVSVVLCLMVMLQRAVCIWRDWTELCRIFRDASTNVLHSAHEKPTSQSSCNVSSSCDIICCLSASAHPAALEW